MLGVLESLNDGRDLISNLFEQARLICAAHLHSREPVLAVVERVLTVRVAIGFEVSAALNALHKSAAPGTRK